MALSEHYKPMELLQHARPDETPKSEPLPSQYSARAYQINPQVQMKYNSHILPVKKSQTYEAIRQVDRLHANGEVGQAIGLCLPLLSSWCLPKVSRAKFHLFIAENHLMSDRRNEARSQAGLASGIVQCDYELIDTRNILQKYSSLRQSLGMSAAGEDAQQQHTRSFQDDPHNRPCNDKSMAALRPSADRLHNSGHWKEAMQSYLTFLQQQPNAFPVARLKALVRVAGYAFLRDEHGDASHYLHRAHQLLSSNQELLERKVVFGKLEQIWKALERDEAEPEDEQVVMQEKGTTAAETASVKRKAAGHANNRKKKKRKMKGSE